MAKLPGTLLVLGLALSSAPAFAGDHDDGRSLRQPGYDRPYVFFVPGDFGRSGRFVSWDDGYFARGGGVEVRDARARYDYDRGYPYDYYYEDYAEDAEPAMERHSSCHTQWVADGRKGESPVRVCRN